MCVTLAFKSFVQILFARQDMHKENGKYLDNPLIFTITYGAVGFRIHNDMHCGFCVIIDKISAETCCCIQENVRRLNMIVYDSIFKVNAELKHLIRYDTADNTCWGLFH